MKISSPYEIPEKLKELMSKQPNDKNIRQDSSFGQSKKN